MKLFVTIFLILFYSMGISTTFDKAFGGSGSELSLSVKSTYDGGYIIAGATNSIGTGGYDGYLIKIDSLGIKEWEKTYGGLLNDIFFDVQQTSDYGYVVVGSKNRSSNVLESEGDFWLLKVDKNGKEKWSKSYEDSINGYVAAKIKITQDNGFIILGSTRKYLESMVNNVWVMKTDDSGNELWSNKYDSGTIDHGVDLIIDNNFIFENFTILSDKSDNMDFYKSAWVFSIDNSGAKIKETLIPLNIYSSCRSIARNLDDSYIITGSECSFPNPYIYDHNLLLIRLNSNLSLAWKISYESDGDQYGNSIIRTNDGCYTAVGTTDLLYPNYDFSLTKFDSNGTIIWNRVFNSDLIDFTTGNLLPTKDNGFIFTGISKMTDLFENGDISLIKTDALGNVIYPPTITSFDNTSNNISINWETVSNAGSYIVYCSDWPDSNFVAVDTTSVTLWNSVATDSLKKKFYYIKASTNSLSK